MLNTGRQLEYFSDGQEIINTFPLICQTSSFELEITLWALRDSLSLRVSSEAEHLFSWDLWSGPVTTPDPGRSWVHSAPAENTSCDPECFLSHPHNNHRHIQSESREELRNVSHTVTPASHNLTATSKRPRTGGRRLWHGRTRATARNVRKTKGTR